MTHSSEKNKGLRHSTLFPKFALFLKYYFLYLLHLLLLICWHSSQP